MYIRRIIPIEREIKFPVKPPVSAVENCGEIPAHLPKQGKSHMEPSGNIKRTLPPKPVSFPLTLGGTVDLNA